MNHHTLLRGILYPAVILITASLLILSCAAHRRAAAPPVRMEELTDRLGIDVTGTDNAALYRVVAQWLGTPHRMGRSICGVGTDCSGFVTAVYREVYGKALERSSGDILARNCRRIARRHLREGDLVFFHNGARRAKRRRISHVGIYLKDGLFAHTSTSRGVVISSLDEEYYSRHWVAGGTVQ